MYVAHAGDSAVIMATQKDKKTPLQAMLLTEDHKPESPKEKSRIERNGGRVLKSKSSYRVCWERVNHPGTKFEWTDHMPYLGIARSLGDFWSWNERSKTYLVRFYSESSQMITTTTKFTLVGFACSRHRSLRLGEDRRSLHHPRF